MIRLILGLAILIGFGLYVRHQYQKVIQQVTTRQAPIFPPATQQARRKCLLCGGTGKAPQFVLGAPKKNEPCPTCNGTGWIQDQLFGGK